jgi:hypothetical protein
LREDRFETGHHQRAENYHGRACILFCHSRMFEAWAALLFQIALQSPMELKTRHASLNSTATPDLSKPIEPGSSIASCAPAWRAA